MSAESRPRRHPEASFRPVGEEGGLVVLPTRGEVQVLNPVAIRIYALLDGTRTEAQIAAAVAGEFDVPSAAAADDVREFLGVLRRHGMLAADGEAS